MEPSKDVEIFFEIWNPSSSRSDSLIFCKLNAIWCFRDTPCVCLLNTLHKLCGPASLQNSILSPVELLKHNTSKVFTTAFPYETGEVLSVHEVFANLCPSKHIRYIFLTKNSIHTLFVHFAVDGLWVGDYPDLQDDSRLLFKILVSFYNPTDSV